MFAYRKHVSLHIDGVQRTVKLNTGKTADQVKYMPRRHCYARVGMFFTCVDRHTMSQQLTARIWRTHVIWLAQVVKDPAAPKRVRLWVQEVRVRTPERTSSTLASIPPGWVK